MSLAITTPEAASRTANAATAFVESLRAQGESDIDIVYALISTAKMMPLTSETLNFAEVKRDAAAYLKA